jgi:hypothetical protein
MSDNDNSKVQKLKERYANEFIQNMNVENYIKLNEFCRDHKTTCFLMKGKRWVLFPNDYEYKDHDFNDETGRFKQNE